MKSMDTKIVTYTLLALLCITGSAAMLFYFEKETSTSTISQAQDSEPLVKDGVETEHMSASIDALTLVVQDLSISVKALAANQELLESQISALSSDGLASAQASQPVEEVLSREEQQRRFAEQRSNQRDGYETLIQSASDSTEVWSAQQERRFETLFLEDPVISGAHNGNVECSNGYCRLEYEIPKGMNSLEKDMLDMSLSTKLGNGISSSMLYTDDLGGGDTRMTFYLTQSAPVEQVKDGGNDDE